MREQIRRTAILWSVGLILAVVLVLQPPDQAMGSGADGNALRKGCEIPGMEMMFSRLDLSDAQKRNIALILKAHREEGGALVSNVIAARKNLFNAIHAPQYNESLVRQAAHEAAVWEIDLTVLRAEVMNEIRNVLTPEQKDEVAERQAQFGDKVQDRFEECFVRLDKWIEAYTATPAK